MYLDSYRRMRRRKNKMNKRMMVMSKLGGVGGWFGDYLCVDCACISGRNQFTIT